MQGRQNWDSAEQGWVGGAGTVSVSNIGWKAGADRLRARLGHSPPPPFPMALPPSLLLLSISKDWCPQCSQARPTAQHAQHAQQDLPASSWGPGAPAAHRPGTSAQPAWRAHGGPDDARVHGRMGRTRCRGAWAHGARMMQGARAHGTRMPQRGQLALRLRLGACKKGRQARAGCRCLFN